MAGLGVPFFLRIQFAEEGIFVIPVEYLVCQKLEEEAVVFTSVPFVPIIHVATAVQETLLVALSIKVP